MEITHLRNSGVTIGSSLEGELEKCTYFSIATAFIDVESIELLEDCLKNNKYLKEGRLLIGIYGHFNRQAALEKLDQIAREYSEKLLVRVSENSQFHWKYYHFEKRGKNYLYIGSANFTQEGLFKNSEILVKVAFSNARQDKEQLDNLLESFDTEWHLKKSCPISEFDIENYKESKLPRSSGPKGRGKNSLFPNKKQSEIEKKQKNGKAIVFYLRDYLSNDTEKKVLNYHTSWANERSYFLVCNTKMQFEICKQVNEILILLGSSRKGYKYSWVTYSDSDIIKTDEGKYFVSYSFEKPDKKLTQSQYRALKEMGIHLAARKKPFFHKVLGKNQYQNLRMALP